MTCLFSPLQDMANLCEFVIDCYKWKNRVKGQPLDLYMCQPWRGDTMSRAFTCETCKMKVDVAYELMFEWGDTRVYENTDYLCSRCALRMIDCTRNAKGKTIFEVTHPKEAAAQKAAEERAKSATDTGN